MMKFGVEIEFPVPACAVSRSKLKGLLPGWKWSDDGPNMELTTPPLRSLGVFRKGLDLFYRKFPGMVFHPKGAGLHVHIDIHRWNLKKTIKLFRDFVSVESWMFQMVPPVRRLSRYCSPFKESIKKSTQEFQDELEDSVLSDGVSEEEAVEEVLSRYIYDDESLLVFAGGGITEEELVRSIRTPGVDGWKKWLANHTCLGYKDYAMDFHALLCYGTVEIRLGAPSPKVVDDVNFVEVCLQFVKASRDTRGLLVFNSLGSFLRGIGCSDSVVRWGSKQARRMAKLNPKGRS